MKRRRILMTLVIVCFLPFTAPAPASNLYMDGRIKDHLDQWKCVADDFKYSWGLENNRYNLRFLLDPRHYDMFAGLPPGDDRIQRIHLTGWWKLRRIPNTMTQPVWDLRANTWHGGKELQRNDIGLKQRFWLPGHDDSQWPWFFVPWDWNRHMSHKSYHYFKGGVGWFRRKLDLGRVRPGDRVILHFEYVGASSTVWVNGRKVGSHAVYEHTPGGNIGLGNGAEHHDFDITHAMKPKTRNTIVVRAFANGLHASNDAHLTCQTGGIWQACWIDIVPPVHASTIHVIPNLRDSTVLLRCSLTNTMTDHTDFNLHVRIKPWQSHRYAPPLKGVPETTTHLGRQAVPNGHSRVTFKVKLTNPVAWTTENPFLYHLQLYATMPGALMGRKTLIGQARFGFREFTADTRHGRFRLNGKRISLAGLEVDEPYRWDMTIAHNIDDWCTKWYQSMRNANVTFVRFRSGHYPDAFYQTADEVGVLLGVERLTPLNNDDTPEFAASVKRLIDDYHNHPSVVLYSLGDGHLSSHVSPEDILARSPQLAKTYQLYKRLDNARPITAGAGSNGIIALKSRDLARWPPTDFHAYLGDSPGGAWHYARTPQNLRNLCRLHNSTNPGRRKPCLNTGCGDIGPAHYDIFDPLKQTLPDMDRTLYAQALARFLSPEIAGRRKRQTARLLTQAGLGACLADLDAAVADAYGNIIEKQRLLGMEQAGFQLSSLDDVFSGMPQYSIWQHPYRRTTVYDTVKKQLAPLFVAADKLHRNAFAGKPLTFTLAAINDTLHDLPYVEAVMEITSGAETISRKKLVITPFGQEKHHRFDRRLYIPASLKTGHYTFALTLQNRNGEKLADNRYRVHILGKQPSLKGAQSRKTLLYLGSAKQGAALTNVLHDLGLTCAVTRDFSELDRFPLLIIGPDSLDAVTANKTAEIHRFVRGGGRLLVLSQSDPAACPVVPGVQYCRLGPPAGVDIVTLKHPVFSDLDRRDFRLWNSDVFPVAVGLTPLTPAVLAAAIAAGGPDARAGMCVGEVALGKGLCLFSQIRAVENCRRDSVAARYLANLIRYCTGQNWTGAFAAEAPH